ncbi:MAG: hypothetical protein PHS49_03100 [Candidatus Gracilibacteria bacterium]|nr:hypothetical protein [Candidatus Gracilibacteria bacterium]
MTETKQKLIYFCPVCKAEYKKEELINGNLPIHVAYKTMCTQSCKSPQIKNE